MVTRAALPAACHMPLATAIAAWPTATKHARYGNAHPHTVLPFVVEHEGGINKGGDAISQDVPGCSGQRAEYKGARPALLIQQGVL